MFEICAKLSVGAWVSIAIVLAIVVLALVAFCIIFPVATYLKVRLSGQKVSLKKLMEIKLSKQRLQDVVGAYLFVRQSGFEMSIDDVVKHNNAGGNIETVVRACVLAKESNIDLSIEQAKSLDLSGRNCLDAVKSCLVPKQVETSEITAISKDGMEVKMKLKITLQSNIRRFVGGSDEQTIISRVEEAVSSAIGSCSNYKEAVEHPEIVADNATKNDLDSGSMYQILSLDAVSVSVGSNVALRLVAEKAEEGKRVAVAKSEQERQKLVCKEQEMKVKTEELKGQLAKEEAEVPKALIEALKQGKLSTMDFLNIENIKSDTRMRNAITQQSLKNKNNMDDFDL